MEKKFEDFDMQQALRLANSPAGRQLLAALRQIDSSAVEQAAASAAAGDIDSAGKALSGLLEQPQIQALLRQLGR